MKDSEMYLRESILDFSKLAQKMGLNVLSKLQLEGNVNSYVAAFTQKLINSELLSEVDNDRREELLKCLESDLPWTNI